jgi:AAA domain
MDGDHHVVVHLTYPSDAVVVVAGVPGAGKTTLIRRAVDPAVVQVVDTEDRREAGRGGGVARLYGGHYARIAAAIAGRRPVVIHSRGTSGLPRRAIAVLAGLRGRPAHLILLDVDRETAEASQRRRGRTVGRREMSRQVVRWRRLVSDRARRRLGAEGWASVVVLDRAQAVEVDGLRFRAALACPRPVPAAS